MKQVQTGNFKDFWGRDLDACISQAMQYYDCPRESLEVEIVQDAKSGIFGIVGARKAKIRARRAKVAETVASLLGRQEVSDTPREAACGQTPTLAKKSAAVPERPRDKQPDDIPEKITQPRKREVASHAVSASGAARCVQKPSKPPVRDAVAQAHKKSDPAPAQAEDAPIEEQDVPVCPVKTIEELDKALLEEKSLEIVDALLKPLAGREIAMSMEIAPGGPRIRVDWQGDAGLLIGRDGQTLSAIQYLASRMLSHAMGAALRVQLDIGNYRARQDDRLRELARNLAEKARQSGRPFSTRPLSSYHRRIIHLCLQNNADVQTRSIGDGLQKRVLISPRRPCQQ